MHPTAPASPRERVKKPVVAHDTRPNQLHTTLFFSVQGGVPPRASAAREVTGPCSRPQPAGGEASTLRVKGAAAMCGRTGDPWSGAGLGTGRRPAPAAAANQGRVGCPQNPSSPLPPHFFLLSFFLHLAVGARPRLGRRRRCVSQTPPWISRRGGGGCLADAAYLGAAARVVVPAVACVGPDFPPSRSLPTPHTWEGSFLPAPGSSLTCRASRRAAAAAGVAEAARRRVRRAVSPLPARAAEGRSTCASSAPPTTSSSWSDVPA